jgi:putative ABC transport system permease protein
MLHTSTYNGVVVVASGASTVTQVTNELTATFGDNIRATAVTSLTSTIQSITQGVSTLLEAVAGTSVIVAFVGIMTTMLTSVLERTTEIGVLKSLGASSRSIMLAFITEASVTGVIGGVVGAGAGAALSYVIISLLSGSLRLGGGLGGAGPALATRAAGSGFGGGGFVTAASSASTTLNITPVITPELIIIAILIATAVGTLGGILPAWRASRLTPVEALHRS